MLKMGKWMIVAGALAMFGALCVLPAALGENPEPAMWALANTLFSLGLLFIAGGIYTKARLLQSQGTTGNSPEAPRRIKGGCDLCGTESPAVQCKVHQLHLCGTCLAMHYDFRSCAYVPSSRRTNKPGAKTMVARQRGA